MASSTLKKLLILSCFVALAALTFAQETHDHEHEGHTHAEDEAASSESHEGHAHGGPESAEDCASYVVEDFNIGMRVGSIFIILATTAIGIYFPMLLHRIKPNAQSAARYWVLTVAKFFGTGVILAVAFIHMIPEALERFESPCLSSRWHTYHGFPGVFALAAVFFIQLIELAMLTHLEKRKQAQEAAAQAKGASTKLQDVENASSLGSHENGLAVDHHGQTYTFGTIENDSHFKDIGTIVLEVGIIMHSVIIGITLGTGSSDGFTTLLIALVFHQFFEGIALGTRLNEMHFDSFMKPFLMALAFCLTAPIGVAIGIGINLTLNPYSESSALAQGILDSLAAGILLYSAFISLISTEINHNTSFLNSTFSYKLVCLVSMYIGAALMAVLGTWA